MPPTKDNLSDLMGELWKSNTKWCGYADKNAPIAGIMNRLSTIYGAARLRRFRKWAVAGPCMSNSAAFARDSSQTTAR